MDVKEFNSVIVVVCLILIILLIVLSQIVKWKKSYLLYTILVVYLN